LGLHSSGLKAVLGLPELYILKVRYDLFKFKQNLAPIKKTPANGLVIV
jgi:hypothetical protein